MRTVATAIVVLVGSLSLASPTARPALDEALRDALQSRDLPSALTLIARGADVETHASNGKTVLMMAAAAGDGAAARVLLQQGADVQAANRNGGTALLYAALQPDPHMVNLLIAHGAAVDHASTNGWSALTVAAAKGHRRVIRALLDAGADPNRQDIYGWTPLMRAIDTDHPSAAHELLRSTALSVNTVNDQGQSALHLAAAKGVQELVRALMNRGSDPQQRDHAGVTPSDLAHSTGHGEVIPLLRP